jgi:predicted transcriptional regulator
MKPIKTERDPRGGHIRLYWELVDSNAWRCLSSSDQRCYIALLRSLRSSNNGDLSLPFSVAKDHGIKSQSTLAKSLRALVAVGLIAVTRRGGCQKGGQRLPTLYRTTDQQCYEMPKKFIEAIKATNEWKEVRTLAQGRAMIRHAEAAAKAAAKAAAEPERLAA